MTKNCDKLREALIKEYRDGTAAKDWQAWAADAFTALAASKPEPQAQAAEPEVLFRNPGGEAIEMTVVVPAKTEFITLKSHREAMERLHSDYLIKLHAKDLGADGKDAALKACVEALKQAREDIEHWAGYASDYFRNKHDVQADLDDVDAAITQAQEAMK